MKNRYLRNVSTLEIDRSRCNGCKTCLAVCPHGVFEMREKKAAIAQKDACMECGGCANNCEKGALAVRAGVGCAAAIIGSALGNGAACCSGGTGC